MYNVSTCNLILDKILMTSSGSSFINEAVNKAKFEATQILRCSWNIFKQRFQVAHLFSFHFGRFLPSTWTGFSFLRLISWISFQTFNSCVEGGIQWMPFILCFKNSASVGWNDMLLGDHLLSWLHSFCWLSWEIEHLWLIYDYNFLRLWLLLNYNS